MRFDLNQARRSELSRAALALALAGFAATAHPALANPVEDPEADQNPIIVTGHADEKQISAGKTPTPIIDTPQSVEVIDAETIADRSLQGLAKALTGVPGIGVGTGEGHRDQIVMRGQGTTADFFVDGMRDDVQYYRGLYNVERIEILKGPNAMTFGRGGGGGIINRVEKRAFDGSLTAGSIGVDTFGAWSASADLNRMLAPAIGARLNATYEEFKSNRDFYSGHRWAINPTFGFGLGGDNVVTLSYEHAEDDRTVDRGIPSAGGRPLKGARDTYFGSRQPGVNQMRFSADSGRVDGRFGLADGLILEGHLFYGAYDKGYTNVLPNSAVTNGRVKLYSYGGLTQRENLMGQVNLLWEGQTGALEHTFLAGIDGGNQQSKSISATGRFAGASAPTNEYWIAMDNLSAVPAVTYSYAPANRSLVTSFGAYAQDQIAFGPAELLLGLRYDRFKIRATNGASGVTLERKDSYVSPRAGLVLHPVKNVSLYASYATTFLPQSGDQFSSIDATTRTLEPEKFVNYEVGAKWQANPALLLTIAAYQLDRTNTRAPDPANPQRVILAGEQRSKGIELGVSGKLLPNWSVQAGAAFQEAKIRETTSAAPAGRSIGLVPEFMASLWTRYDVNDRFGLGLGVEHQAKRFAALSNAVTLPAYTRVDAAAYVTIAKGLEAQLNVENLFNATYWATAHNDNNIQPGTPRSARVSLRFQF